MGKFTALLNAKQVGSLHLVQARDVTEQDAWYYMKIEPLKLPIFMRMCEQKAANVELLNYGNIIESGYGDEPPIEVQNAIDSYLAGDTTEYVSPVANDDVEVPQGETRHIRLMQYFNGEEHFYHYVLVPDSRLEEFEAVLAAKIPYDLKNYGEVVASGWGELPDEATRNRMEKDYGANHEWMHQEGQKICSSGGQCSGSCNG